MTTGRDRHVLRLLLAGSLIAILVTACSGPTTPQPAQGTTIKGYPTVDGSPAVELSDGKVYLLQDLADWQIMIDQFPASEVQPAALSLRPAALPSAVDLLSNQTAIRDQGGRNTCVAFATTAAIEAAYKRLRGETLDLSEQYANHIQKATALPRTLNALPARETQLGAWGGSGVGYQLGWLYRLRFGLPPDADLPYISTGDYERTNQPGDDPRLQWDDPSFSQQLIDTWNLENEATTYHIPATTTLTNLPRQALADAVYGVSSVAAVDPINLNNLKQALADGREVAFGAALTKPAAGESAFVDGVWVPTSDDWGGHAMLMVGYDDAKRAFIVKNSWGRDATGRGRPGAADANADGFILMSYDWVPRIGEAYTVVAVRDTGTWQNQQPFLGDWSIDADYPATADIHGHLDVYHLPGAFPSSSLSGATDLRLGTLYTAANGDHRVNGSVSAGTGHITASFERAGGADGTYDFADGQVAIDAYTLSSDRTVMAGWSSRGGSTVPFYGTLDGLLSGTPADTTAAVAATDYLGAWRLLDDDGESVLRLGGVDSGGRVTGRLEGPSATVRGVLGTLDGTDPCRISLDVPFSSGSRTYNAGLFCSTDGRAPRTVMAGTSTPTGASTPRRGFVAVRTGSAVAISITSPSDGSSFPRGSVNVPLSADVIGASSVTWTSSLDGVIGTGASTSVNDLPVGTQTITVTATASDGATASDSVTITITNDPPSVAIVEPDGSVSFCTSESITFSATATDLNEPPDYTLGDSAVTWRVDGSTTFATGKSVAHAFGTAGTFTVVVRATDPQGAFAEDSVDLTVVDCPTNQPPSSVSITDPPADTGTSNTDFAYDGFDNTKGMWYKDVALAGEASDPEDGALTGSALVWTTDRTDLQVGSLGTGGSLTVRLYSDVCTGTWHEITLSATDSGGLTRSTVRRIFIWTLC